ncbi:MAG: DUF3037 domain-containing protein [Terriglobales bacterium]
MTAKYTVLRYVPDAAAAEFVNIGVALQIGDDGLQWRITDNVGRIAALWSRESAESLIAYVRDFLQRELNAGSDIATVSRQFKNSLQFSDVMACEAESAAQALDMLYPAFVREQPAGHRSTLHQFRLSIRQRLAPFFQQRRIRNFADVLVPRYCRPDFEFRPNGSQHVLFAAILPAQGRAALERSQATAGASMLYRKTFDSSATPLAIVRHQLDPAQFDECTRPLVASGTQVLTENQLLSFGEEHLRSSHVL